MEETIKIKELIKRAKLHEQDAFTELMQFFIKDMYKTATAILMNDYDAADAIQDTLLRCWEKIDTLKNDMFFKTWMTRILINRCFDIRKRYQRETSMEEYEEPTTEDVSNLEFKEMLSVLDEKYRIPMFLFYGQEYKISEIAKILGIPKSTVQTRLARGRAQLANCYQSEMEEQ